MECPPELSTHFKIQGKRNSVYSDNEAKKNEGGCKINGKAEQEDGQNEKKKAKIETFWTVCPYCYNMYEYEKAYEECCLRCQNCRRAFHGVAVGEPNNNILVGGKDEYYCGLGFFPLMYLSNDNLVKRQKKKECRSEISDDNDDNDGGCEGMNVEGDGNSVKVSCEERKGDVLMGNVEGLSRNTEVSNEGKKVVTRKIVKSVARKSKKIMGRGGGVKNRKIEAGSESASGIRDGCSKGDLEFSEKDGDVWVGINSTF